MNQQPGRWAPTWVGLQRLGREGRIRWPGPAKGRVSIFSLSGLH